MPTLNPRPGVPMWFITAIDRLRRRSSCNQPCWGVARPVCHRATLVAIAFFINLLMLHGGLLGIGQDERLSQILIVESPSAYASVVTVPTHYAPDAPARRAGHGAGGGLANGGHAGGAGLSGFLPPQGGCRSIQMAPRRQAAPSRPRLRRSG